MAATGDLTVALLAFNEAPRIGAVIDEMRRAGYRVLVMDDGSTDDTDLIAGQHGAEVWRHGSNRGYGAAVRTAIGAAQTPWVAVVDGDGQFGADAVAALLAAPAADAVWGVRRPRADGVTRAIVGRAWALSARVVLGVRLQDVDCGAKLLRKAAVRLDRLTCDGPGISAELALKIAASGGRIAEAVVPHRPRSGGRATGLTAVAIAGGVRELAYLRREDRG